MLVVIRSLALTWMAGALLLSGCANPAGGRRVDQVTASVTAVITRTTLPSPTTTHTPAPTPSFNFHPDTHDDDDTIADDTSRRAAGDVQHRLYAQGDPLSYLSDTCASI
jgi:PBP1b-binding outer membrane lipoprotein LpoB